MRSLFPGPRLGLRWRGHRAPPHNLHSPRALHVTAQAVPRELDADVEEAVKAIHATRTKAVLYTTGGAVQAVSWLLSVPGASNTVLEASVPYARDSLVDVLGKEPEQFCSEATAVDMAVAAYRRAANLCAFGSSFVGVGATCSLATAPLKRGEHRAYVAVHGGGGTRCASLTLSKGARSRMGEDDFVSRLLVKLLAEACGCDVAAAALQLPAPPQGAAPDVLHDQRTAAGDPIEALLHEQVRCVEFCGAEVVVDAPRGRRVYLPGSFNPLHEGHKQLLAAAVRAAGPGWEGAFELTVQNADKGFLTAAEVRKRVTQFVDLGLPVVITRAPIFTIKADLLPHSRFVVGYDTVVRMVLPKYYKDSYSQMVMDFARLRSQGCSFITAGRLDAASGRFLCLADVAMPPELADLYPLDLPEDSFRMDISSTELRKQLQASKQAPSAAAAAPGS